MYRVEEIAGEYQQQNLNLTVRQVFYQFVVRDYCRNTQKEYNRLQKIIADGRMCGIIDWDAIVDRGRYLREVSTFPSPRSAVSGLNFHFDLWRITQTISPEIWVEKDAALGVIERVCKEHRLPYFAGRGYSSITAIRDASERFKALIAKGIQPIIYYLGDHDPSGVDMPRFYEERLGQMTGYVIDIRPIALTMDQVREFKPISQPVKLGSAEKKGDPRAAAYVEDFGKECWELDALDPSQVYTLITTAIANLAEFDEEAWCEGLALEADARKAIATLAKDLDDTAPSLAKPRGFTPLSWAEKRKQSAEALTGMVKELCPPTTNSNVIKMRRRL